MLGEGAQLVPWVRAPPVPLQPCLPLQAFQDAIDRKEKRSETFKTAVHGLDTPALKVTLLLSLCPTCLQLLGRTHLAVPQFPKLNTPGGRLRRGRGEDRGAGITQTMVSHPRQRSWAGGPRSGCGTIW